VVACRALADVTRGPLVTNDGEMMNGLWCLMKSESEIVGAVTPEQLVRGFERLGLTVHRLVDAFPRDRLEIGDQVGLSPSWVIGHLALLLRSVLESLGGPAAGEFPSGFAGAFGPGRDGTEVREEPALLIGLFDRHLEMLSASLKRVDPQLVSEPTSRDEFGLLALMPHHSLGGHAAAALRYAGMYVIELAMLCDMS
jgi:hypothetical protein